VALKKSIKRTHDPDFLFVEPSEMVVTRELRDVAAMARRDITFELGPYITLVNGPEFESDWQEREALLTGQVLNADVVAISRFDRVDDRLLSVLQRNLADCASGLLPLSIHRNIGMDELLPRITGNHTSGG
jgi:G3E family GTPase